MQGEKERITSKLRDEMHFLVKGLRTLGRGYEKEKGRSPYRPGVNLCLERPRLLTQSYKETEGQPFEIRRAKALVNVLENMTLYIGKSERIVGNFASTPDSLNIFPELYWRWLDKAIDNGYGGMVNDEERKELHEIHAYWDGRSVHGMERDLLPEEVKPYWKYTGAFLWLHGNESGTANFNKIFSVGLNGIIREAEEKLKEIEASPVTSSREYLDQRRFLNAAIISLKAAIRYGQRYAEKARELAKEEDDPERRKELGVIAEICDWVPGNPPRTFREGLQCFFLICLVSREIEMQTNGLGVRFDQILYPLYKKDIEEDRLSRDDAQELVEYLWLKMNEYGQLRPPLAGSSAGGIASGWTITIGGVTPDGDDATNELSYIVLDASKEMRLQAPMIALRYHDGIPHDFVLSTMELLKTGVGYPAIYNDKFMIPMLLSLGIPIEDARDWAIEVCMRWTIPGKNITDRAVGGFVVLPKFLELALNKGVDKLSGRQTGCATRDPLTFTDIEDVIDAYLSQLRFFMDKLFTIYNIVDILYQDYLPRPFLSALMDGCIESGRDLRRWRYLGRTQIQPIGQITLADSIAATKKLVFDEKRVSMSELIDALQKNWEGKENLRQMFINEAPKFGNDDDYVDLLARDVLERTTKVIQSFRNEHGHHFSEDGSGGASYFAYSALTGATPDGRKDGDLFNDGTLSPCLGMDKNGPTAVLNSTSKVDPLRTHNLLLNQKFLPQYLEGEYVEKFAAYLKTWADLGHHHIQFNIINRDTLIDAQKNQEEYAHLVVRVAGYTAYFTDLTKDLQDQIIQRTEQKF